MAVLDRAAPQTHCVTLKQGTLGKTCLCVARLLFHHPEETHKSSEVEEDASVWWLICFLFVCLFAPRCSVPAAKIHRGKKQKPVHSWSFTHQSQKAFCPGCRLVYIFISRATSQMYHVASRDLSVAEKTPVKMTLKPDLMLYNDQERNQIESFSSISACFVFQSYKDVKKYKYIYKRFIKTVITEAVHWI